MSYKPGDMTQSHRFGKLGENGKYDRPAKIGSWQSRSRSLLLNYVGLVAIGDDKIYRSVLRRREDGSIQLF
jgi:hypothetical protein